MNPFGAYFTSSARFENRGGIYFQRDLDCSDFERAYVPLRRKEGRLHPDAIVQQLPAIADDHPHATEWHIRRKSAGLLSNELRREKVTSVLEVGCGNGWLIHRIQKELGVPGCGVDIETEELQQAQRLFGRRVSFVHGDIRSIDFDGLRADAIVVASCIQYFPDVPLLVDRLLKLLNPNGSIHIVDSPWYQAGESVQAQQRSLAYFEKMGVAEMNRHYRHHELDTLRRYHPELLNNPFTLRGKVLKRLGLASPFPWIRIRKTRQR